MTDNITLPRAVFEELFYAADDAFSYARELPEAQENRLGAALQAALFAFDTALAEPDAKREPATDGQIFDAYQSAPDDDFYYGWCAAERFHGISGDGK